MKKRMVIISILCMLACLVFVLGACSNEQSGSSSASTDADDVSSMLVDGKFVVGFDQEYPPYGYVADDGSYTGLDLDLAAEVCSRNGWEFEAMPIDWDSKDAELNSGTITCIWNGFTYEGREDDYAFSGLYMINKQVIVTKADSDISSLDDLAGKNVITQAGSAALDALNSSEWKDLQDSFNGGSVSTIADYNNAFLQLESGTVDAVACDLSIADYHMSATPGVFKQLEQTLTDEHYAVGFKLGSEALASRVTSTLEEMDADGSVQTICEKYADQGVSYDNWCLE